MPLGLRGADLARREQQVERVRRPDQARQQPADAVLGDQAALRERGGELRLARREAEVGVQRDHEAEACGRTVERGDDRLSRLQQVAEAPAVVPGDIRAERARVARGAGAAAGVAVAAFAPPPGAICCSSFMSAPAQKPRPAPVSTITRTASSATAAATALLQAAAHGRRESVRANSGRFSGSRRPRRPLRRARLRSRSSPCSA